ncbi:MAG: hypothetical protein JWR38_3828 [Mucilaginibacter sp.]|nr:hypothetical protein [Mucilaginibacter sp.]
MLRYLLLVFIGCVITSVACAQGMQNGTVLENKTRVVLEGIQIENKTTTKVVVTDKLGRFSIPAKTGDLLVFTGAFYRPDTVLLTNLLGREVFLTPKQTSLEEVKVNGTEIKAPASGYKDPDFHGQTMVYQRDPKTGYYKGGVALRLHYWTKDDKKRKKEGEFIQSQQVQDEITEVFSPDNLTKYVPLTGDDMNNFILLYIPSVKTYTSPEFSLTTYLDASYKKFLKLTPEERKAGQLIK